MRAIDSIFIILAFGSMFQHPKQKYLISLLPILVFSLSLLNTYIPSSIEPFVLPLLAILVCIFSLKLAPVGLLLLFSYYGDWIDVLLIPLLWFSIVAILKFMDSRLNEEYIPSYIRGLPIRLISLGILYHVVHPLLLL